MDPRARLSEIGPSRCAGNGCELQGRRVYRAEKKRYLRFERGQSGSLACDRAPSTGPAPNRFPRDFRRFRSDIAADSRSILSLDYSNSTIFNTDSTSTTQCR